VVWDLVVCGVCECVSAAYCTQRTPQKGLTGKTGIPRKDALATQGAASPVRLLSCRGGCGAQQKGTV